LAETMSGNSEHTPLRRLVVHKDWQPSDMPNVPPLHEIEVAQVFVPLRLWSDNAISFGQLRKDKHKNLQVAYMCVMQLFIAVAKMAWCSTGNFCCLAFEKVEHRRNSEENVGMQVRLTYQGPSMSLGKMFNAVFERNYENMKTRAKKPQLHAPALSEHEKLTLPGYRALVKQLTGRLDECIDASACDGLVDDHASVYYPTTAFNIGQALVHASNMHCNAQQSQIASYYEVLDGEKIRLHNANPCMWFQVHLHFVDASQLHNFEFPFVPRFETVENPDRTLFYQMHSYNKCSVQAFPDNDFVFEIEAQNLQRSSLQQMQRKFVDDDASKSLAFDQSLTRMRETSSELNSKEIARLMLGEREKFAQRVRSDEISLKAMRDNGSVSSRQYKTQKREMHREWCRANREITVKGLAMMKQIFHIDGPMPESIRNIASWLWAWNKKHLNFCMPVKRSTSNLSPYQEAYAREMVYWENLFGVNAVHGQISTTLMCVYAMLNGIKGLPHPAMFGPPEAGKTYVLDKIFEVLIPKSAVMLTYSTPKAKTGATGDEMSFRVELYQEATPAQLGIEQGRGNTTAGATNNTDSESMFKTLLTEGQITVQTMVPDPITNKRRTYELKVDCHVMVAVCSNALVHNVPDAIRSRLLIWKMTEQRRIDNGGIAAACSKKLCDKVMKPVIERTQRNQALAALIGQLVLAKVFQPVSMDVAHFIYAKMMNASQRYNMKTFSQPRNRSKFMQLVMAVCIQRAIHTVFDFLAPGSTLPAYDDDDDMTQSAPRDAESSVWHADLSNVSGSPQSVSSHSRRQRYAHMYNHDSDASSDDDDLMQHRASQPSDDGPENDDTLLFHRRPFRWEHLLELQKHMFVKVEDCVLVFGMLMHMYEDPIFFEVVDTMKREWFKNGAEPVFHDAGADGSNLEGAQGMYFSKRKNYYVLHGAVFDRASDSRGSASASHVDARNAQHIERLASQLLSKMTTRPQLGEVVKVLAGLVSLNIQTHNENESMIPAFLIQDDEVRVSSDLIDMNRPNQVEEMLKDILSGPHEIEQHLLCRLGGNAKMSPFLFDPMHVRPDTTRQSQRASNFDFVPQDEINFMNDDLNHEIQSNMDQFHTLIVDMPLDRMGAMRHKRNIFLSSDDEKSGAPIDTLKFMQWSKGQNLPRYPDMFARSDHRLNNQRMHATINDNEQQFSMSHVLRDEQLFSDAGSETHDESEPDPDAQSHSSLREDSALTSDRSQRVLPEQSQRSDISMLGIQGLSSCDDAAQLHETGANASDFSSAPNTPCAKSGHLFDECYSASPVSSSA
jgi:hypothetical protein